MTPQHSDTDTQTPPPTSLETLLDEPLEIKLHLLRHYAELARLLAQEILEDEVTDLAGERYSRNKPHQGRYRRWGTNPGSIRLDGERVPSVDP